MAKNTIWSNVWRENIIDIGKNNPDIKTEIVGVQNVH